MRTALLFILPILAACSFFGTREYKQNPDPNHTHADFAIWIEGEKIDFAEENYMSRLAGNDGESEYRHEHLHLHDEIGHVIHRHKPGLTLGDFLNSLGFRMSRQCLTLDTHVMVCPEGKKSWQMFVNREQVPFDATYAFEDVDQILLTYGANAENVQAQLSEMTDDACLYSKTCPWRGDPPAENCIADPDIPCIAPIY